MSSALRLVILFLLIHFVCRFRSILFAMSRVMECKQAQSYSIPLPINHCVINCYKMLSFMIWVQSMIWSLNHIPKTNKISTHFKLLVMKRIYQMQNNEEKLNQIWNFKMNVKHDVRTNQYNIVLNKVRTNIKWMMNTVIEDWSEPNRFMNWKRNNMIWKKQLQNLPISITNIYSYK